MIKRIDYIYNLSLYETENIHTLIGWVPKLKEKKKGIIFKTTMEK